MSLTLKWMQAATMATSYTTTLVGGAISTAPAVQITGSGIAEVFFSTIPLGLSGGTRTCYQKVFALNDSPFETAIACLFWLLNSLDDIATDATVSAQSTNALDDSARKIRILGFDPSGDPIQAELNLNGLTLVTTGAEFSIICRIELRDVSGLVAAAGDITIYHDGVEIGMIPAGFKSASNEVAWGRAPTQDDTATIATATTPPTSVTMSKPRTEGTGFGAVGADIPSLSAQGIWMEQKIRERAKMSVEVETGMRFRANSAA